MNASRRASRRGAPLILALAAAPLLDNCSTGPGACDASSCSTGCCDRDGTCVSGTAHAACGTGAARCTDCTVLDRLCAFQECRPRIGGGSDGGCTGACANPQRECVPATSDTRTCTYFGNNCWDWVYATCAAGESCSGGVCRGADGGAPADAGPSDGGVPSDAGASDAATADAGQPVVVTIPQIRTDPSLFGQLVELRGVVVTFARVNRAQGDGAYRHDVWVQQPTVGPNTGLMIFVNYDQNIPAGLAEGDLVNVVGYVSRAPSFASGNVGGRLQLSGGAAGTLVITKVGTAAVPLAVLRAAAQVQPTTAASPEYLSMKVRLGGPVTAVDGRPALLQRTLTGYNGFGLSNGTLVEDLFTYLIRDATDAGTLCDYGGFLRSDGGPVPLQNGVVAIWDTYLTTTFVDAGMIHALWPFRCTQYAGAE